MDILTQGLIGAACAGSAAREAERRWALGIGFFTGMLADLDVLIRSAEDPLRVLEFHRHFTHALAFVPLGALLGAGLAWLLLRRRLAFGRIYLYAFLGYLPAGLLDACTSYGTHLLWPFSEARIALSLVSVVDPLFSLALAGGILLSLRRGKAQAVRIGLALALLYLGFGLTQRERAVQAAIAMAAQRGHAIERLEAKPSFGNTLLWRTLYEHDGMFQVDAVRVLPGQAPRHYPGTALPRLDPASVEALPPGSSQAQDLRRFQFFSDGWLVRHPDDPLVIGDLRYAGLPNGVRPLWGIRIDPARPDRHVAFEAFRSFSELERRRFLQMLRGVPLQQAGQPAARLAR
jgi:inner membrane protein